MTTKANPPRIEIMANGPYVVTGGLPLLQRAPAMSVHGEPLDWDPVGAEEAAAPERERYALCRCGQSANKPFCDGTHARAGFDGALTADRRPSAERRETFVGEGLILTDDTTLCADAGFCGTRFSNVWSMIERTGDPEVRARLERMVANCPSGRIQFSATEGDAPIEPAFRPSVATIPDGPLWVRGGVPVQAPDGHVYEVRNRVTLCRCGRSQNKPYCDSAHKSAGFEAP